MKKFWKILLIAAECLGAFGLVCLVLGYCLGGMEQAYRVLGDESGGIISFRMDQEESPEVEAWPKEWPVIREDSYENLELATDDQISQIRMEVDGSQISIEASDTEFYGIVARNVEAAQYYRQGDALIVRTAKGNRKEERLTLYIPENANLSLTEIEIGGAELIAEELDTDSLLLQAGAGQFVIERLEADKAEIQVGAGNIEIRDGALTDLVVEAGMGHLSYRGSIEKEAEVTCGMGAVHMEVAGKKEDFVYETECMMGDISVSEISLMGKQEWGNSAEKQMELTCNMGVIEVTFYEDGGNENGE